MLFGNPVSILLIEDDSNDAALIRRALRDYSRQITFAHVDTETTLRAALDAHTWDIALCDYSLPGLTLDIILGVLEQNAPGLPIVMVTGTVGEEAVADLMRRGVADVVLKDRLASRLVPILTREIGQSRQRRLAEARMQRVAAVLGFFNEATDWRAAMELSLAHIGETFGAGLAVMCELTADDQILQPIAEWANGSPARQLRALLNATSVKAKHSLLGRSMLLKEPIATRFVDVPDLPRLPLSYAAANNGMVSFASQPLPVGGRSFGIALTFPFEHDNLQDVLFELDAISKALLPVLFRKISDSERTLLLDALNATSSGVIITEAAPLDAPGPKIVYANQATYSMTGYDQRAMLGNTPRMLQGAETDLAELALVRQALEMGAPVSVEVKNYRRDGIPFWVALDITPVRDRSKLTHFIAIQTDITARRAAEQERLEREASFRMLFENNPMPMWVYDLATLAFLEVNTAAVLQYGWSREAFLQRTVYDINPAADPVKLASAWGAPDAGHSTVAATHSTATGERLAVRVARHGITYQGGRAMLAVIWDITEMERGRSELRRVNEDLAQTTEVLRARTADLIDAVRLARMGTWSLSFTPRVTTWSPETYAILGQDPAHFIITPASILGCIHPDDRAMFGAGYKQLGQTGGTHEMEYRIIRPSGDVRVLRELARPKYDAAGAMIGMAGVMQDVTEQKNAEQALLRAEKLKTIGQITGGIAHDFNNLLTVVGLNLEAALEEDDLSPTVRETLEPALHAARRGGELTMQMLSYARGQSPKPRVVSLSTLLQTVQPLLLRAVGERHRMTVATPSVDMRLEIDPGQFENALMNLVINARDAMIRDGAVDIGFATAHVDALLEAIPDDVPRGDYIRFRVTDTGGGIDPAILPKIFEPFFTTKPSGTGTGLGLSMVHRFVQQSRGYMTITSAVGVGTTVDLYFPIAETAMTAPPAAETRKDFSARQRSVLVVEDGDALRHALHRILSDLGFNTVSVATANEALEYLASHRTFDLLFSDITLPGGVDGIQLAAEAEMLRPDIAIVLTSGNADQIDPSAYARWHLLPKPFQSSAIKAMLNRIAFR